MCIYAKIKNEKESDTACTVWKNIRNIWRIFLVIFSII